MTRIMYMDRRQRRAGGQAGDSLVAVNPAFEEKLDQRRAAVDVATGPSEPLPGDEGLPRVLVVATTESPAP